LRRKAEEFAAIPKLGRTQLQDAVGMTLGQEFGEAGHHARSAVGFGSLPGNITVEIEAIVALRN